MGSDVCIGRVQEPERLKPDVCETADPADETVCRTALERDKGCGGKSGNGTSLGTSDSGKGGHDRPAGETSKQIVTRNIGLRQASGISSYSLTGLAHSLQEHVQELAWELNSGTGIGQVQYYIVGKRH